ncbi:hypothetical protein, partial [Pseudomonas laurylsulfatiphila]|uniref:hypothetical protein n=1 Tax=Pseudomonas laurylsulfatiphila TaxID=2011015 RepID=UPI003D25CF53
GLPAMNASATRLFRQNALSFTSIASKLAPTSHLHRADGAQLAPSKGLIQPLDNNRDPCGSGLARDERQRNAFIQTERVIVYVHREQARSYK